jgi:D-lactate dehydrogenase
LTTNALKNLADTTLQNIKAFESGRELVNEVSS